MKRWLVTLLVLSVLAVSCGATEPSMTGVVVDVNGDLSSIETFTLLTEDGARIVFFPAEDATFHGGPLTHLSAHVTSGEPVRVFYEKDGNRFVALRIEDA